MGTVSRALDENLWGKRHREKERSKNWVLGAFTFRRRGNTEKPVN